MATEGQHKSVYGYRGLTTENSRIMGMQREHIEEPGNSSLPYRNDDGMKINSLYIERLYL